MRIFQLTIYALAVTFLISCKGPMYYTFSYKDYSKQLEKGRSVAYVTAKNRSNSTYFIHSGDSIIQLKNVIVSPENGSNRLKGDVVEIDSDYQLAYEHMEEKKQNKDEYITETHFNFANQSHLFVDRIMPENGVILIDRNQVQGYHQYHGHPHSVDKRKTALGLGLGLGLPLAGLGTLIAVACNCPHVYISDGEDLHYTNTMFTGAVSSNLERFDIKRIPDFHSQDNLLMRIANEDNEVQHINLSELQVVSHAEGIEIVNDQAGNFYSVKEAKTPNLISSIDGVLNLKQFKSEDEAHYAFDSNLDDNLSRINVAFNLLENNTNDGRLLLTLKNSDWAGVVHKGFIQLFGDKMTAYRRKNANDSKEKRAAEFEKQGVPLVIEVNLDGKWQKIETINLIGATNFIKMAINIPSEYLQNEAVTFRLSTGYKFWDLDYIGFDNSSQSDLHVDIITAEVAEKTSLLVADDANYLTLNKGDFIDLNYNDIPEYEEQKRSIFIRSKGFYESHETGEGPMQKSILMKLNKKGGLSIFSYELYNSYMDAISEAK